MRIETARGPEADLSSAYQRVSDGSARYETFAFRIESAQVTAGMRSPIRGIGCKLRSGRSDLEGISNKTDLQLERLKGRNRSLHRQRVICANHTVEIGRASVRERVWKDV